MGAYDMALMHYRAHLNIARELKDTAGEACALLNLGNKSSLNITRLFYIFILY